ncbi:MAG: methyltransferase domain-containing protein [Arcobacteraceae bacterium]
MKIKLDTKDMMECYFTLKVEVEKLGNGDVLAFEIENEDVDFKSWVDLSQMLFCKMLTPEIISTHLTMRFKKLNKENSFHNEEDTVEEKYGSESIFATIDKNQHPAYLVHYIKALENVKIDKRLRILNLGVNSGEEFEVIKKYSQNFQNLELVGVDYCSSAIKKAKRNLEDKNISFLVGDITKLEELHLGKFDLIISVGTLQSSNLDFNKVFMNIVQNYLDTNGAMILGFPNCRWVDNEMIYGSMVKNYNFSELSLLFKDVNYCKKYLQQKKYRVTITGKDYIFLTATSIRK